MNNPFDYTPDASCGNAFRELTARIESLRKSDSPGDINFLRELEAGKMLGVLVATDSQGQSHTLYAFSGQLGCGGFHHPGFVEPVFDYLQPDGYFKTREAEISRSNAEISLFEKNVFSVIKEEYEKAAEDAETEISEYREKCRRAKQARDIRRASGLAGEEELAAMTRRSQHEKAELHRLKKRLAATLEPFADRLKDAETHLLAMKEKRRSDSEGLQEWLFANFRLLNARGESRSLKEIFAETSGKIPPSGAGECCAPKLLQSAYLKGWHPESIAEYWYGKSKGGEVRMHGRHYPACRGKCLPVLGWMLQGLDVYPPLCEEFLQPAVEEPEIIFENRWFCVVSKPSGMLSVPGKGQSLSVEQWLIDRYGADRQVRMAHRLDQGTSGLLIATFGLEAFRVMQSLFAMRKVKKTYVAQLDGDYKELGIPEKGRIDLPLSADWLDRPRQRVDLEGGKESVTEYEFTGVAEGRSRILFYPSTGRTHQLRVHAASEMGLGMPISGDPLYGANSETGHERLCLHARNIEFIFPLNGSRYCFESPTPF